MFLLGKYLNYPNKLYQKLVDSTCSQCINNKILLSAKVLKIVSSGPRVPCLYTLARVTAQIWSIMGQLLESISYKQHKVITSWSKNRHQSLSA